MCLSLQAGRLLFNTSITLFGGLRGSHIEVDRGVCLSLQAGRLLFNTSITLFGGLRGSHIEVDGFVCLSGWQTTVRHQYNFVGGSQG